MADLIYNFLPYNAVTAMSVSNNVVSFFAFNVAETISLNHLNMMPGAVWNPHSTLNSQTLSLRVGMYVLTQSSLSLINSGEMSTTMNHTSGTPGAITLSWWADVSNWYSTQVLTPGTWFIGVLPMWRTSNATITMSNFSMAGIGATMAPANALDIGFVSGRAAASTADLPSLVETATLDVTGRDAINTPCIIISS